MLENWLTGSGLFLLCWFLFCFLRPALDFVDQGHQAAFDGRVRLLILLVNWDSCLDKHRGNVLLKSPHSSCMCMCEESLTTVYSQVVMENKQIFLNLLRAWAVVPKGEVEQHINL